MMNTVKLILAKLKSKNLHFELDGGNFEIHKGTFSIFLQLEKLKDEDDYTCIQVWFGQSDDTDSYTDADIYDKDLNQRFTETEIDEIIDQAIDEVEILNATMGKVSVMFIDVFKLLTGKNIQMNLVDSLYFDARDSHENQ